MASRSEWIRRGAVFALLLFGGCRDAKQSPADLAGLAGNSSNSGSSGASSDDALAWATFPMPNATAGLPNVHNYDTATAGVVTDRVTGLMWQRAVEDTLLTAEDSARYCEQLTLAKQDDWRLPTRLELVSLLDVERTEPAIDVNAFPNTPNDWFWTSSVAAVDPTARWYVYFYFGYPKTELASNRFSVRCVRDAAARRVLSAHYDVRAETARDLGTGLIWQRTVPERNFTFDAAAEHCKSLTLGDTNTWRVPSLTELLTLVDERAAEPPMIDSAAFPNTPSQAFWSSSYFGGVAGQSWQVYFDHGNGLYGLPTEAFHVRCVR